MGVLEAKTALVTGAAKGIGRATVERFLSEGAHVFAVVRPASGPGPAGAHTLEADITDPASMAAAVACAARSDRLDVCVANAGAFLEYDSFIGADIGTWDELIRTNLVGVLVTLQAAARQMTPDRRGGRLLVTSSLAGLRGEPRSPVYGATKAALHAIVQSLAVELAPFDVTVNAVAPGQIRTQLNERNMRLLGQRRGQSLNQTRDSWVSRIPARRLGEPAEVAAAFAFLASDEASFITGEVVRVDGGELVSQGSVEPMAAEAEAPRA
jgi:NAD(P)-dependent dehydrogenase (short-subunit alcohol dehydrogenase family)